MNLGLWFPRAIRLHPRAGDSNGASTFLLRNFGLYGDFAANLAKVITWSFNYGLPVVLGREQSTRLDVEQAAEQLRLPFRWTTTRTLVTAGAGVATDQVVFFRTTSAPCGLPWLEALWTLPGEVGPCGWYDRRVKDARGSIEVVVVPIVRSRVLSVGLDSS